MEYGDHIRVLLVEDNEDDAVLFRRLLSRVKRTTITMEWAESLTSALDSLSTDIFDIIVTDLGLPDSMGIDTFLTLHSRFPETPVIVLTGISDEDLALKAVQKGAQDYLVKGEIQRDLLVRSIRYSIERQKLSAQFEKSQGEIKTLKGLIPICAWCRKTRDDKGYWKKVETYIEERTDASFSHGICPECLKKIDPMTYEKLKTADTEAIEDFGPSAHKDLNKGTRVLLIEDDAGHAELISRLSSEGEGVSITIEHSDSLSLGISRLEQDRFDLVIAALSLPDSQGLETFIRIRAVRPDTPVILLTKSQDEGLAIQAVRSGAQDYLVRGKFDGSTLVKSVLYSIERQRLLTALSNKLKDIRQLERERKNILTSFANDIKNSIVPSVGFLTSALSGKDRDLKPDLAAMRDELMIAEHLLTNFIEFSRFEDTKYKPLLADFDIGTAILQQIEGAKIKTRQKDIEIICDIPELALPTVKADGAMIRRVISNLLDNAIKYTDPGGKVKVKVSAGGFGIVVAVTDSGAGLSDVKVPFVFDAFYRAADSQRGAALGLSIAKTIINAHKGEIRVESTPGTGSTFSFTLPIE